MWLFDEAGVRNQVDDGVVSSSSLFMLEAKDCNEDAPAVTLVALDILEMELSLLPIAVDMEDGTWVVVDAFAMLKVAMVALLSALMISFVFIFIDDH